LTDWPIPAKIQPVFAWAPPKVGGILLVID
jgi:hypothetical protein